jgi:hypothetical protein
LSPLKAAIPEQLRGKSRAKNAPKTSDLFLKRQQKKWCCVMREHEAKLSQTGGDADNHRSLQVPWCCFGNVTLELPQRDPRSLRASNCWFFSAPLLPLICGAPDMQLVKETNERHAESKRIFFKTACMNACLSFQKGVSGLLFIQENF